MELFNILAGCKIGTATIPAAITNIFHTLFLLVKWGVPILLVIWVLGFIIGNYIL